MLALGGFARWFGSATALLAVALGSALSAAEPPSRQPAAVRLAEEFPAFHRQQVPPYSVFTDEPADEVGKLVHVLASLRGQFERQFAPLLQAAQPTREIQVVLFGRPDDFRRYARRVAPAFASSAGFYAATEDRLALVAQRGPVSFTAADRSWAGPGSELLGTTRASLPAWHESSSGAALARTQRVIRHEGAHQLFAHYRVHSPYALEPTWITEGLAEYCAPAEVGGWHLAQVRTLQELRRTGRLLPLDSLLNQRDPAGFFALGLDAAEAGYAQSWALAWLLLQPAHRERFLGLLRFYRDTDARAARQVEDTEPAELLYAHLGCRPEQLAAEWEKFLEKL